MKKAYKVISLYCFSSIKEDELFNLRDNLFKYSDEGLTGLIILAKEGINGTICGREEFVNHFHKSIKKIFNNFDLNEKISFTEKKIFKKLKIKIKKEIVTMGISNINPKTESGIYVDPDRWNNLLNDENTIVIDTRNHYETSLGSFKDSINPKLNNFREFPDWLDKNLDKLVKNNDKANIAMFCTGGIRCEKATSLLRNKGMNNVYHLKGGILKYLENIPPNRNLYKGECYVFDERVAVDKNLKEGSYSICHACGMPLSVEDKKNILYVEGVQCHLCIEKFTDCDRARFSERQKQIEDKNKRNNLKINLNS
tara:strand:+ start:678 stop:1610 length:933 start_codon:yes stop_codon:yes gene_type:complete